MNTGTRKPARTTIPRNLDDDRSASSRNPKTPKCWEDRVGNWNAVQ